MRAPDQHRNRPHRYRPYQHNNRTPRIDLKRCSMQPEVSRGDSGAGIFTALMLPASVRRTRR
jgi:hypothetical protein